MNLKELKDAVRRTAGSLLHTKGYISPVDLLMNMGKLSAKDYEAWRRGQVPYLERVCAINLSRLSLVMKELRSLAREKDLKPSWTAYRRWGKGPKSLLRFSKSGDPKIEEAYATHYLRRTPAKEVESPCPEPSPPPISSRA